MMALTHAASQDKADINVLNSILDNHHTFPTVRNCTYSVATLFRIEEICKRSQVSPLASEVLEALFLQACHKEHLDL